LQPLDKIHLTRELRVDDLDLPHAREQREALARRADGTALVRGRHGRAGKQFRRVNGHMHLRSLRDTLNRVTETVSANRHDEAIDAA
jgi:hypothetical protein